MDDFTYNRIMRNVLTLPPIVGALAGGAAILQMVGQSPTGTLTQIQTAWAVAIAFFVGLTGGLMAIVGEYGSAGIKKILRIEYSILR